MAGEIDGLINQPSESEQRINQLSGNLKKSSEEKEAALAAKAEAEAKLADAERKAVFAEGFTEIISKNPSAGEFKKDIQDKFNSGYSLEDATFAVLGKAGKLSAPVEAPPSPAGGSATTSPPAGGAKAVRDMNSDELRSTLEEQLQGATISDLIR